MKTEPQALDIVQFLRTVAAARLIKVKKHEIIYTQGVACNYLYYIVSGKVKISVTSQLGKEATVALLSQNSFFGETCLQNPAARSESATAWVDTGILKIDRMLMIQALQVSTPLSSCFIHHLLLRNVRYQEDLVSLFFNFSEKRLARVLLELYDGEPENVLVQVIPKISHEVLAEMVGTTRSRVSFFMRRFRSLGLLDYGDGISIKRVLLAAIVRDGLPEIQEEQDLARPISS